VDRHGDQAGRDTPELSGLTLTGAVVLSEERLRLLAPLWEATHRNLRRMDSLERGDTEPATIFVWKGEQQ
jgi:hypothetical protein